MKILLAEDQAMVRGALASLLRLSSQHELVEAADGDAALALLKQQSFDMLLTDIEMPGRSGLELAAWLQHQQKPDQSGDYHNLWSQRLYPQSARLRSQWLFTQRCASTRFIGCA
ncbi:MAG: response regulator [Rheinheimera sp.]|nr:response regulator [Rheinheimera sp.]